MVLAALERKRPEVAAHCRRVSRLLGAAGRPVRARPDDVIETIRLGALLHDVGKMLDPVAHPREARPAQRAGVAGAEDPPRVGRGNRHRSGFDDEVVQHRPVPPRALRREGYPDGLTRSGHPLHGPDRRVMDTFDALTSSRDYRERLSADAARALIARSAGSEVLSVDCQRPARAARAQTLQPGAGGVPRRVRHPEGPAVFPIAGLADYRLARPVRTRSRRPSADASERGASNVGWRRVGSDPDSP